MSGNKQTLATYSPEEVVVIITNPKFTHQISGFSEDSMISATRLIPHAELSIAADKMPTRTIRSATTHDVTFTLGQASETNDLLTQLMLMDANTKTGEDIFSLTIKDTLGRTRMFSRQAFIGTTPDIEFGASPTDRVWVIHCVAMDVNLGGNAPLTPTAASTLTGLGAELDPAWVSR